MTNCSKCLVSESFLWQLWITLDHAFMTWFESTLTRCREVVVWVFSINMVSWIKVCDTLENALPLENLSVAIHEYIMPSEMFMMNFSLYLWCSPDSDFRQNLNNMYIKMKMRNVRLSELTRTVKYNTHHDVRQPLFKVNHYRCGGSGGFHRKARDFVELYHN